MRFFSFFSFLPFLDDRLRLLLRLRLRRRLSFLLFFVDFFLRSRDDDDRDDDDRDDRDREDDDPDRLLEPDPDDGLLPRLPAPFSPSSLPLPLPLSFSSFPLPGGLRLTLRRQIHGIGRFRRSSARASRKDPGPGAWGADPYDGPAAFG